MGTRSRVRTNTHHEFCLSGGRETLLAVDGDPSTGHLYLTYEGTPALRTFIEHAADDLHALLGEILRLRADRTGARTSYPDDTGIQPEHARGQQHAG